VWNSSEIYFQAKKFEGTEHEQIVRAAETSQMAADMGRERSRPLRADWNDEKDMASLPDHATLSVAWAKHVGRPMLVKDYIMLLAVRAKFTQHEDLKQLLISTAESLLVEHTKNDSYWADGGDGTGVNMLGKILMIVRDEINCAAN
jgi:predicted NAD-dependent protein-ADP-ribosyltransferase YbiA (DUF1768 family)